MKESSGRITHRELVDLGYIFLTKGQEDIILKTVNDAFARLVGQKAIDRIAGQKNGDKTISPANIRDFLMKNQDDCEEIVKSVRIRVLQTLQKRRKRLLMRLASE